MEWRHSGLPRPIQFLVLKSTGNILGIKTASSSLITFQRAKLSTRSITHPCWCNWRTFKKNAGRRKIIKGGLVLARQSPGSPGTCNPEETGLPGLPTSWSPTLFSGSGPVRLPPVQWTEKKTIERSPFFVRRGDHCCCGDLFRRTNFWFFLSGLQKLEQRAKKCIELHGE